MQKLIVCIFLLLSIDCFAGETIVRVQCNCPGDFQLYYIRDAVVYKSERVKPIQDSTGLFSFKFKIEKPVLAEMLGYSFIILPDDNVRITISKDNNIEQWKFTGRNSENYSFMRGLSAIPKFDVFAWKFDTIFQLQAFKEKAKEHYERTLSYYQSYIGEQKTSDYFNRYAKLLLKTLFLQNLMYPVNKHDLSQTQLPEGYFADMDSEFLNQPELTGYRSYILLLSDYVKYLKPANSRKYYDTVWVEERIQSFKENFTGEVRSNMLLFTYANLVLNGPISLSQAIDQLHKDLLRMFSDNSVKVQQVELLYKRFKILGRKLPGPVFNSQLIDVEGRTILLHEMLNPADSMLIYIDFWASWCGPCKDEMPASEKLYGKVKSELPVEFVYVSLDKDENQWKKGIVEIAVSGKHYRLPKDFKSDLIKYIDFNSIPRYIIINSDGVLIDYDAARPSQGGKLMQTFKAALNIK